MDRRDFPGYTEVTCPCCGRYKHVRNERIGGKEYRERMYDAGYTGSDISRNVVCDNCWAVVEFFVNKEFERLQQ